MSHHRDLSNAAVIRNGLHCQQHKMDATGLDRTPYASSHSHLPTKHRSVKEGTMDDGQKRAMTTVTDAAVAAVAASPMCCGSTHTSNRTSSQKSSTFPHVPHPATTTGPTAASASAAAAAVAETKPSTTVQRTEPTVPSANSSTPITTRAAATTNSVTDSLHNRMVSLGSVDWTGCGTGGGDTSNNHGPTNIVNCGQQQQQQHEQHTNDNSSTKNTLPVLEKLSLSKRRSQYEDHPTAGGQVQMFRRDNQSADLPFNLMNDDSLASRREDAGGSGTQHHHQQQLNHEVDEDDSDDVFMKSTDFNDSPPTYMNFDASSTSQTEVTAQKVMNDVFTSQRKAEGNCDHLSATDITSMSYLSPKCDDRHHMPSSYMTMSTTTKLTAMNVNTTASDCPNAPTIQTSRMTDSVDHNHHHNRRHPTEGHANKYVDGLEALMHSFPSFDDLPNGLPTVPRQDRVNDDTRCIVPTGLSMDQARRDLFEVRGESCIMHNGDDHPMTTSNRHELGIEGERHHEQTRRRREMEHVHNGEDFSFARRLRRKTKLAPFTPKELFNNSSW